jgi:hypothetical protein
MGLVYLVGPRAVCRKRWAGYWTLVNLQAGQCCRAAAPYDPQALEGTMLGTTVTVQARPRPACCFCGQHRLAGPCKSLCKSLCTPRMNREPTRRASWAAQDRRPGRPEPTFAAAGGPGPRRESAHAGLGAASPPGAAAGRATWPAGPGLPPPGRPPGRRRAVANARACQHLARFKYGDMTAGGGPSAGPLARPPP